MPTDLSQDGCGRRENYRGRTFVYVLPCRNEDLVKVGFSKNPAHRFCSLHPEFYDYFDMDSGLLIETDHLKDARRTERIFLDKWQAHKAPPPLLVNNAAGGASEWFRGITCQATELALRISDRYAYKVHAPLRVWLYRYFFERSDLLYEWSSKISEIIESERLHLPRPLQDVRYAVALTRTLRMYEVIGFNLNEIVSENVLKLRSNLQDQSGK